MATIEDDPASRDVVRYLIASAGHTTLLAAEGGAAVRLAIGEHHPRQGTSVRLWCPLTTRETQA